MNIEKGICKCCNQPAEIMTINEIQINVNKYIKNNTIVQNLLKYFQIEFENLSYAQNRSRLEKLANKEMCLENKYSDIYSRGYPIYLNLSEDFKTLEGIEISLDFFRDVEIMNILKINKQTSDTVLENFLKEILTIISPCFKEVLDELTIKNGIIQLRLPNNSYEGEYACNYYPETKRPYIFYYYDRKEHAISNIRNFEIVLNDEKRPKEKGLGKWLSQQIVLMYPDYGDVCFWFPPRSTAGSISSFSNYINENSLLYKEFQKWTKSFYDCEEEFFCWEKYNKKGKELHRRLQEVLRFDYILVYCKSYEEYVFREKQLGFYDEDEE